jgi:hypothetical protein
MSRDIQAAYRDAMIEEHAAYKNAGRAEDAAHVADTLKARFDYDVDASSGPADPPDEEKAPEKPAAPEHAAAEKAPETAAEPKPAQAAKKAAPGRPARPGA